MNIDDNDLKGVFFGLNKEEVSEIKIYKSR